MELNIAHIQHFSTGDGPGIRTTVFFKGCNFCLLYTSPSPRDTT